MLHRILIVDAIHFSAFNHDIGVSRQTATASAVHGWANRRGYGGFTTAAYGFGSFSYEQFRENILAGRPMNLAVSTNGKTDNINHVVLGVAFNDNTNEVGILDGWKASDPANPPKVRWIKWQKVGLGIPWGIGWILEVIPPEKSNLQGPNTGLLENKGGSKAYYRDGFTGSANNFNVLQHSKISNLGASTIALASANGHRFWHLIDDGSGTAALYQGESRGDGNFIWLKLSDNTGANRTTTVGLATADGKVFWQLWDDGVGTLALVERKLELPQRTLTKVSTRRLDTGLSRSNTLGVAMENSNTLLAYVKSGNNNVSIYSLNVSNHSSTPKLVKSNITGMDDLIDVVRFKRNATVASDGDGAVQSRGLAQRDAGVSLSTDESQSIDVSEEDRDNWGVVESVDTEQFGDGVIQPRSSTASDSDSQVDNGDEALGDVASSDEGGAGSVSLLQVLLGLLLLWLKTPTYNRRFTLANK